MMSGEEYVQLAREAKVVEIIINMWMIVRFSQHQS